MTLLYYHDIFLKHGTGGLHPECPGRLEAIIAHLQTLSLWDKLRIKKPRKASEEDIALVHSQEYIHQVKEMAKGGGGLLDPDTLVCRASYEVALYAAGALLDAVDAVMAGKATNAFCMVRPPGHHATPKRGMGFCLFNNVAIAARYLLSKHHLQRVLIMDWDCHHGNGTQEAFYEEPKVFYISLHRWPFYPGTGNPTETGKGPGEGFTLNVPLGWNASREDYINMFEKVMRGEARAYRPEFVLISAGFDTYDKDPIAGLGLEAEDFGRLTELVLEVAEESAAGRIVSCLEGGYSLEGLPLCVEHHLR
ncbi:MAG TPA: histone deacetylase family protein, partial [Candidatus Hypogeohydataceae bacterium YC41]